MNKQFGCLKEIEKFKHEPMLRDGDLECTDPQLGLLLDAYEFDSLDEEDQARFDAHLFDCTYCAVQYAKDLDVVEIIKQEKDLFLRPQARETSGKRSFWAMGWVAAVALALGGLFFFRVRHKKRTG